MYVKRLTMHGFKSFPQETAFEFGPGVTAIVGPNGSGKSNVADAVRWVLGEQGLRLLRARKQEDVIFSGGGERAPLGMAEVTLTLDNSDHWLPLDFAEVEIGRRAYRDGDSEYLVNGSRVRLRDLVDLLQKANVGQNSYAIMGQGMVDEVLSLSPQDRRSLIDEAADVKRFRAKIADAHNRLADTRDNMAKVQLIIAELEPRLRQLRRQSDRASEHRELSGRLAGLLREYYGNRWSEAQNAVVRLGAELDQRKAEDGAAAARVTQVREQLQALNDEIVKRREAVARRDNREGDFDNRTRDLEHAIALDRERHAMTSARHAEARHEVEALEGEKATVAAADLEEGRRALDITDEVEAARTTLDLTRSALDLAQREDASLRGGAEELRSRIAAIDERADESAADAESASRAQVDADHQLEQLEARRKQLLVELIGYGRRFAELRTHSVDGETRLDEARKTPEEARARLTRVQAELREQERAGHDDLRKLDHLEGRFEALRRVQAESEGVARGTRNVLVMGQVLIEGVEPGSLGEAPEISGVVGLLSRQLKVPPGLEAAINAALEQRLHAIVVESEEQAFRAIELLRKGTRGRAQFLPLDTVRHAYPLNLQKERGVVGVASKLVKCENRFRDLVDTLLGRVIVVEDRAAGQRMLSRGLGSVVTADGTFLEPSGVIAGGAAGETESAFTRQRELDEIPAQIEELRSLAEVNSTQMESARQTVESLSRVIGESEGVYDAMRRERDAARADHDRERDRLHRLRRDMTAVLGRRRELTREDLRGELAGDQAREFVTRLGLRRGELSEQLDALASDLTAAAARSEAAMAEVSEASGRLAAVDGERRALTLMREQHERSIERFGGQITARLLRVRSLELEAAALDEAIERQTRELEQLRLEQGQASDDIAPDRDELHRLESHERAVQAEYEEAQTALLEAQRQRLDLEAERARAREHLQSLRGEMSREGLAPVANGEIAPQRPPGSATNGSSPKESGEAEPAIRGGAILDVAALEREIDGIRVRIRRLGPINEEAPEDFRDSEERHAFLTEQVQDLTDAGAQLQGAIGELNGEIRTRFSSTFAEVDAAFGNYFAAFFGGGSARLQLLDPDDVIDSGIEIEAQPPGKRLRSLSLLSGGERSLTAVALLFALLSVNPAPFCVLDEVDAALDEANVGRFLNELARLADRTQFLIVTHNRRTVEATDAIYGVSMGPGGASQTLSLRLSDLPGEGGSAKPPEAKPKAAKPKTAKPKAKAKTAKKASTKKAAPAPVVGN